MYLPKSVHGVASATFWMRRRDATRVAWFCVIYWASSRFWKSNQSTRLPCFFSAICQTSIYPSIPTNSAWVTFRWRFLISSPQPEMGRIQSMVGHCRVIKYSLVYSYHQGDFISGYCTVQRPCGNFTARRATICKVAKERISVHSRLCLTLRMWVTFWLKSLMKSLVIVCNLYIAWSWGP